MTRDDIIRLVQEAGIYYRGIEDEFFEADMEMMVKFAALAAAAERDACALICDQLVSDDNPFNDARLAAEAIRARGDA